MKRIIALACFVSIIFGAQAQDKMTPELLWQLGRVSSPTLSKDGKKVIYTVSTPSVQDNKSTSKKYSMPIEGGAAIELIGTEGIVADKAISPDSKLAIQAKEVKINKVYGKDFYPELDKSNVQIYDGLNYRHWDTWEDGMFSHLFVGPVGGELRDIMPGETFDCPEKPFGDQADYTWSPDSKKVVYVTKKRSGTAYAVSTNSELFEYDVASGTTTILTKGLEGYDTEPAYSSTGVLAWLSMKRDGYEADKKDIVVLNNGAFLNLTGNWDGTVSHFTWSTDGKKIFFIAPTGGTIQLFEVDFPGLTKKAPVVKQITKGDFDISGIAGQTGNTMVVSRTDMNHSAEIYTVNLLNGQLTQLTRVNDVVYGKIGLSKIEKRMVPTTDGKQMLVWVIYPPGFDPTQKYPTLLYCQGGPQSALTQFYSFRWNFQLMAAQGYIIVAPNRRGMPGHGVAWNEQISKDHGGQVMQDYLSAIDHMTKEKFVDKDRLACVGASYGGYSVFYLAGIHNNRFKTFISHDGIFNLKSMYGTTEELWFVNWDLGGPYWEKSNTAAQRTYSEFDPVNLVANWNKPILIYQGGKDYRVPDGQAFEAFQAAQLRGIKSKLIYMPAENHWVFGPQTAIVWQREFFKWLKETL